MQVANVQIIGPLTHWSIGPEASFGVMGQALSNLMLVIARLRG